MKNQCNGVLILAVAHTVHALIKHKSEQLTFYGNGVCILFILRA